MITQQNGSILLSLGYQIWTSFTAFLLNYYFLWANNLGSCVFIRIIQLILLYLIRKLWRIDLCIKTLTKKFLKFTNHASQDLWVHQIHVQVVDSNKSPRYKYLIIKFPSHNLCFYNYDYKMDQSFSIYQVIKLRSNSPSNSPSNKTITKIS
jgi:hypothetical protein